MPCTSRSFLILILTYIFTLASASVLFPLLWHCTFLSGLQWNPRAIRLTLFCAGPALALVTQLLESRFQTPKDLPIDKLLQTPSLIWLVVLFATTLAPLYEEVVFRGFILPALALAVDYLRLPRSHAALDHWRTQSTFSPIALTLSTILTSTLFALLHAAQLAFYWPAVFVLFCVSLLLCVIRLRTQSLAASTLVHATYNATILLTLLHKS